MKNMTIRISVAAIALFSAAAVQSVELKWTNAGGDHLFSNTNNWDNTPTGSYDFYSISSVSPDQPVVSAAGTSNQVDDVRVGIYGTGQLDITGGYLRCNRGSGDTRIGYDSGGTVNQSGGVFECGQDLAIGNGASNGVYNLSGGLLSNQAGRLTIGEGQQATTIGELNISGGAFETRYNAIIYGTGTFAVHGSGATSIGIGSQASGTTSWEQKSGGTLEVRIDSGGVTPVVIDDFDDGGDADVTFAVGSVLDVDFVDGYSETGTNTWTVMTWEGELLVDGLQLSTNVDFDAWSFAITNHSLQVTYGIGSVAPTNFPPTGPRTLYWSDDAVDEDMTLAENWMEANDSGGYETASWGLFSEDIVYIGHPSINAEGPTNTATYIGQTDSVQGELYIGYSRTGALNINSGVLDFNNQNRQVKIGYGTRGHGILNMNGGSLDGEAFRVGMDNNGCSGVVNLSGGTITASRGFTLDSLGTSWSLGENGSLGELNISGGTLDIRFGMVLGRNGGTGNVHVEGSDAAMIGIGTKNSGSDGFWIQNSGSTLSVNVDEGGVTPITINGWGDGGAFVRFETNAVLDIGWSAGVTHYGIFDIMTWDGELTDNGLTLSTNVNTNIWSYAFVDRDGDGTNDTLRATAYGETDRGTSLPWLAEHGLTAADDELDNDQDGLLTYEEYIAETNPTNSASVLKMNSVTSDGMDYVLRWQSVAGKSYHVITNTSLVYPSKGIEASVIGAAGETSYTSSVSGASSVFFEVEVP